MRFRASSDPRAKSTPALWANATTSTWSMPMPAVRRQNSTARSGKAFVCFSRLNRSSSTKATGSPSRISAAAVSWAKQLIPMMFTGAYVPRPGRTKQAAVGAATGRLESARRRTGAPNNMVTLPICRGGSFMPDEVEATIDALLSEDRVFEPPEGFRNRALWTDPAVYQRAAADPDRFWAEQAERIDWYRRWDQVMEWNPPWVQWFTGGKLNVAYNCLDRHVESDGGGKVAYYWEGEPGDERTITYAELHAEVCRFANGLKSLGVRKGDRVAIYLGMIPELPVAMLACARLGAAHSVVFGGFSAEALKDRINDAEAKVLITADGAYRRGQEVALKANAEEALKDCPTIEHVVTVKRTGSDHPFVDGRDVWYHDLVQSQSEECPPEPMDAEDILYILYTSGTTGKPKGIVHTTGGNPVGCATTHRYIFDIHADDVYWCAADIGWVTGHSYIVYGPLANHTTGVMYEGPPDWPDRDRLWSIVEKRRVNILYTAPTAIRSFMRWGPEYPGKHDLSSLRLLGTVGEPINPEAWVWYWKYIGTERCPIVDTWWQTETGNILITPLPGITTLKPGSATRPFPGIEADIYDEHA